MGCMYEYLKNLCTPHIAEKSSVITLNVSKEERKFSLENKVLSLSLSLSLSRNLHLAGVH